ncbi:MAG: SDR family oxidoreductase [Betaproteobacteria bacterium]|jgi:gluconate 5-dehydrogenase|nr:SDR family oxidoreductase [Betaproteobacteria bacterium]
MNNHQLFDLNGLVALITGSSRGIGLASAAALAAHGANVFINSRNHDALVASRERLFSDGLRVETAAFDAFNGDEACNHIDQIVEQMGQLDVVFLNAAIQARSPLLDFPEADFVRLIQGNLTAQWVLARHVARHMVKRGFGRIIFTGSVLGLMGRENVAGYSATKAAIHGIVRQMSAELAPSGITVNAVAPGYVKTELTSALHGNDAFNKWLCTRAPVGRWAQPDDIRPAVVFLASREASYVTGQIITVDGGLTTTLA